MLEDVQILVLAGGMGTRMNGPDLPKVLTPLNGQPLISYLLDELEKLDLSLEPAIVVGASANIVKDALGSQYLYIHQEEQLGTGHAVACAKSTLEGKASTIVVMYGDHPLVTAEMVHSLSRKHKQSGATMTLGIVSVPDFNDWRSAFYSFGRVVRSPDGKLQGIVELKDATENQKLITEVNPSYFCFDAEWLWSKIDSLSSTNAQHEYYLTDLLKMAFEQNQPISTIEIDPPEGLGVNTPQELKNVEQFMLERA